MESSDLEQKYNNYINRLSRIDKRGSTLVENIRKKNITEADIEGTSSESIKKSALRRRWSRRQVEELTGIKQASMRHAEKTGKVPTPPKVQNKAGHNVSGGYTLEGINALRDHYEIRPKKPGDDAIVLGFLNFKGGSQKTTNSLNCAHFLAIEGYRVLVVDMDPQASLSFQFGIKPDIDVFYEDTAAPFLLEDKEVFDEDDEAIDTSNLHYAIKQTYWPTIDIIPSCSQLGWVDMRLPANLNATASLIDNSGHTDEIKARLKAQLMEKFFSVMRRGIKSVQNDYDFIIVDGTPSLNLMSMQIMSAVDMCIIPVPAEMADYASTLSYIRSIIESVNNYNHNNANINLPEIRALITKFTNTVPSKWMQKQIRATFEELTFQNGISKSDEITKSGAMMLPIYERRPKDTNNPSGHKKTIDMYNAAYREVLDTAINLFWANTNSTKTIPDLEKLFSEAEA